MDPEICSTNFAAMAESSFKYGEMIMEAVSTINGGNGVDIDRIANYIKERSEVPEKFRKHLRDKLKKLVAGNKLGKVDNCYRIIDGVVVATAEATNVAQIDDSDKPIVIIDMLKKLLNRLENLKIGDRLDKVENSDNTKDSKSLLAEEMLNKMVIASVNSVLTKEMLDEFVDNLNKLNFGDKVENSNKTLDGATEATNLTQISNREDSLKSIITDEVINALLDMVNK